MTAEQAAEVSVVVNGVIRTATVPVRRLLADFLRQDLRLTGTHLGCEHGVCGACTVLVDGRPVRSCLMFVTGASGHEVTTVEGLVAPDGSLHPVQQAFIDCHGLQCGFCTPGFLTTIAAFLATEPDPTEASAREAVSGNLCRCTGYQNIVRAVLRAAELARGDDAAIPGVTTPPDPPGRGEPSPRTPLGPPREGIAPGDERAEPGEAAP
jgi:aerobic carbon-monoxide dehydrogenase small subunit